MDYSPWFDFWESEKSLEERVPLERASQEKPLRSYELPNFPLQ